jgi:hypothetical protein
MTVTVASAIDEWTIDYGANRLLGNLIEQMFGA